jgi:hypothetical protein
MVKVMEFAELHLIRVSQLLAMVAFQAAVGM